MREEFEGLRAEPDTQRTARKQPERRLAHEIALGIVLGGCVLMTIIDVKDWVASQVLANEIRMTFGR